MESDLVFLSQISDSWKKDQSSTLISNVSNSSRISTRTSISFLLPWSHWVVVAPVWTPNRKMDSRRAEFMLEYLNQTLLRAQEQQHGQDKESNIDTGEPVWKIPFHLPFSSKLLLPGRVHPSLTTWRYSAFSKPGPK